MHRFCRYSSANPGLLPQHYPSNTVIPQYHPSTTTVLRCADDALGMTRYLNGTESNKLTKLSSLEGVRYRPKWELGNDLSGVVTEASIRI